VLGGDFLDSLGSFLDDLGGMQAGFHQRNIEVMNLLRSPNTAFLLASYPSEVRYLESVAFGKTLAAQRIPLAGLFLNRLEPEPPAASAAMPAGVRDAIAYYRGLFEQEQHWVAQFAAAFPALPVKRIEKRTGALHDLVNLSELGKTLLQ
jgi:anion-transporting  ArsA/GET3 family ATPase